ncbi:ATP-binding cassette domain-containing protein [Conexibacter woesei]|uniref:ABC transporter related protein n=1 Tax=Conexibacter woesei (strain DSM 14684 / CCUG 47730 / CIP 108061 / JCM 11494 / NBRC 100937 / ID131577) TaxID=469383 RepID=D3FDD4_CONWI|nr:ATP-binding cassette domain-containing protein [Conexibacter woesei]ADB53526.1 ABC transporter related protein [Conexibacter woesei DSM 14684]
MSAPLVEVEHLSRHYPIGRHDVHKAVDDVSLTIARGETFGLVGESGSGKSTLARLVLGLDRPTAGSVRVAGHDLAELGGRALRAQRRHMQIVLQDPVAALNRRKTIGQIVGLPLAVHERIGRDARAERVRELLALVGLPAAFAVRYPHELSGGQCQRVGIARAIALQPDLIVLDEAVSAVDVSIQAQILNLLRDLQDRLGLTYLFVSHNLAVVRYMSSTVAVMQRGRIVETGTRERLFARPEHPYTRELLAAVPEPTPPDAPPADQRPTAVPAPERAPS